MRIVRTVPDPPKPPTRRGWPDLCVLPLAPEDVPAAEWEEYVEDGLGEATGTCVEVEGGVLLGLVRYSLSSERGLRVVAFVEEERLPEALAAALRATGLAVGDLPWVALPTQPFSALRLRSLERRGGATCDVVFDTPAWQPASATLTLTADGLTASPDVLRDADAESFRALRDAVAAFLAAVGLNASPNGNYE